MARIDKLRAYLFNVLDSIVLDNKYEINADFLGEVGDFSLDKVPTEPEVESWVLGIEVHKDVFNFRSRKAYSSDELNNLENIGFFEDFQKIIKYNNDEGILPDIKGIESIECLNCGTLNSTDGTQAIFDIQIQITYKLIEEGGIVSL